jgi:nucleoside-diphosphate-sugar epimerase
MAKASLFVMDLDKEAYGANTQPMLSHINVGCGTDVSIAELAAIIAEAVGFDGQIDFDHSKPDGTARKLMDVSRLSTMGWKAHIALRDGVAETYEWFLDHQTSLRS